jgi:hypothetical protein
MIKDDKGLKDDFGSLGIHYWMLRMHLLHLVVAEAWQEEEKQAVGNPRDVRCGWKPRVDGGFPRGFPNTNKNM